MCKKINNTVTRRCTDHLLLIIDGDKLHSLEFWRGAQWI